MESSHPAEAKSCSPSDAPCDNRRGFIAKSAALAVGAAAYAAPAVGGALVLLDPLRQQGSGDQQLRLASLSSLPADGTPRQVPVIAERVDAWTRSVQPVGAVYLRRVGDKEVEALQVVCPHAGCTIEFKGEGDEAAYVCPCHKAAFDIAGKRLSEQSQSPRDMDSLDVEVKDDEVWVQFQTFQTGTPDKVPTA